MGSFGVSKKDFLLVLLRIFIFGEAVRGVNIFIELNLSMEIFIGNFRYGNWYIRSGYQHIYEYIRISLFCYENWYFHFGCEHIYEYINFRYRNWYFHFGNEHIYEYHFPLQKLIFSFRKWTYIRISLSVTEIDIFVSGADINTNITFRYGNWCFRFGNKHIYEYQFPLRKLIFSFRGHSLLTQYLLNQFFFRYFFFFLLANIFIDIRSKKKILWIFFIIDILSF